MSHSFSPFHPVFLVSLFLYSGGGGVDVRVPVFLSVEIVAPLTWVSDGIGCAIAVDPLDEDFHFLNPEEDEGEDEGQGKAKEGSGEDLEAAEEGQHTEDPTDADASSGQKDESSVQGDKDGAGSEDEAMAAVLLGEGSEEGSIKMMLEEDEENRLPSLRVYLWVDQPPEGVLEHHSLCFIKHDREPIPLLDSFSGLHICPLASCCSDPSSCLETSCGPPVDATEQCEALEQGFEYTAFTAPSLVTSLEQILRDVYIPLLEHSAIPQGYAIGGEGRASDSIRTEFVGNILLLLPSLLPAIPPLECWT